jgi:cation/acetate symporter
MGGTLTREGAALLGAEPGQHLLAVLDRIVGDLGFPAFTAGSKARLDVVAITAALMVGTAGLPHIIIRFFTVPKVRDARATAGWALAFIAILYTTAPAVAVFARATSIATVHGRPADRAPEWFRAWQGTGLVGFRDRDGDGRMTVSADPARNEVDVDPDVLVLATPEIARLPPWVVALVAAGALGAAMSGSGPTVFGVARSFEQARQIRARLTRGAWRCWAVRTMSGPAVRVRSAGRT